MKVWGGYSPFSALVLMRLIDHYMYNGPRWAFGTHVIKMHLEFQCLRVAYVNSWDIFDVLVQSGCNVITRALWVWWMWVW